ncbi:MAG: response regulator [Planctomycetes bacterium]|nr:response regulator [Planctomycetota bacterium]
MQGARILLLDDDRETRWALATVLRREGAQVTEAQDGEEGLRFLMRAQFDLCISDVCMPGLGGFGLYAAIRFGGTPELAWATSLPMILISGQVPMRDLAHALDSGVDDFLKKPFEPEELKARTRAALRRAKLIRGSKARTSGDLSDFGMAALAQALHLAGRSARISVQNGPVAAVLDFNRGQLAHATFEDLGSEFRGDEAAIRALGIEHGVFEILPVQESGPRTVFLDTPSIMLRAATLHDEETGPVTVRTDELRALLD